MRRCNGCCCFVLPNRGDVCVVLRCCCDARSWLILMCRCAVMRFDCIWPELFGVVCIGCCGLLVMLVFFVVYSCLLV